MEKIRKDNTLKQEVSVGYMNFRRDTFAAGVLTFALITLVGLIIQLGWLFSIVMGLMTMLVVISEFIFTRQLFRISFHDQEQKMVISYFSYMMIEHIEVPYKDFSYHVRNYQNKIQLKIYKQGNLLMHTDRNKYGWTEGRVQEVIRMLAFRNIKCIK
jgi:hypothetical protein